MSIGVCDPVADPGEIVKGREGAQSKIMAPTPTTEATTTTSVEKQHELVAALIDRIAPLLEAECARNDITANERPPNCFDCIYVPDMPLRDYMERIMVYGNFERSALLLLPGYIDKMCNADGSQFAPSSNNIHCVVLTGLVVAQKFVCDTVLKNKHIARLGGVSTERLNNMEKHLLHAIDYNLSCDNALRPFYDFEMRAREEALGSLHATDQRQEQSYKLAAPQDGPSAGQALARDSNPGRQGSNLLPRRQHVRQRDQDTTNCLYL